MLTTPIFISLHQIQAGITNIATLMFNRYTKLNSPTETRNLSSQNFFAYSLLRSSWWQLYFSSCLGQQTWSHPGHLFSPNSHLIHWLDINLIQNLQLLITQPPVSFPKPLSLFVTTLSNWFALLSSPDPLQSILSIAARGFTLKHALNHVLSLFPLMTSWYSE